MTYYFVANIKIYNPDEYDKYLEHIDEIFSKYNGEYLSVDTSPVVLEGNGITQNLFLLNSIVNRISNDWYYSGDYQKILKFRLNSAVCDTILIEGTGRIL
jgi:uncharacterized protein (DUF1330 family)